jgi:4-hydroxybenzoate polyprenyltransferase
MEFSSIQRWVAASALGFFYAVGVSSVRPSPYLLALGFLAVFLILCYSMAINDYFDVEIDKTKEEHAQRRGLVYGARDQLVVTRQISKRAAFLTILFLLIGGLAIACNISVHFLVSVVMITLFATFYSAPPFRLKQKYLLSTLCELGGAFFPFLAGYSFLGTINLGAFLVSGIAWFDTAHSRFRHEAMYVEVDKITGKKTIAVAHGSRGVWMLSKICLLLAVAETVILLLLGWFSLNVFSLFVLYLFMTSGYWFSSIPKRGRSLIITAWGFLFLFLVLALYSLFR